MEYVIRLLIKQTITVLAIFLIGFTATSCLLDGSKEIGDGYTYVRASSGSNFIATNDRVIVKPNVLRYAVSDNHIVGRRVEPSVEIDKEIDQPYGYFIIDKKSEEVKMGVEPDEFAEFLKVNNIDFIMEENSDG